MTTYKIGYLIGSLAAQSIILPSLAGALLAAM